MKKHDSEKSKNISVYGIYKTRADVENAVDRLQSDGFRIDDISVLLPLPQSSREFGHVKQSKAPEGAMLGGGTGAIIGGSLGLLAGIGSLAIPGVGPLIAAGPIMAALAGAGAGSVSGGILGSLIGFGFPEYEAKRFEGYVKQGGLLISVHADNDDWRDKAKSILSTTGAEHISSTGESKADIPDSSRRKAANM